MTRFRIGNLPCVTTVLLIVIGAFFSTNAALAQTVQEFSFPAGPIRQPLGIVAGPDGNMWFTEYKASRIGVIKPDGTIVEHPTKSPGIRPAFIAQGPDGNLWFTGLDRIGVITPIGAQREHILHSGCDPAGNLTAGPANSIWFTETCSSAAYLVQMSTGADEGLYAEYPIDFASNYGVVVGPDGNLWLAESRYGNFGEFTWPAAVYSEFAPLHADPGTPWLTVGPDNNLWMPEPDYHLLASINSSTGTISEIPWPNSSTIINGIVTGSDGNLWIADGSAIWRVDVSGPSPISTALSSPPEADAIANGPDDTVWVTEFATDKIAVIRLRDKIFADGFAGP